MSLYDQEVIEVARRYETKLTTDLSEIAGIQQSKYLVPSSVLFNNIRDLVADQEVSNTAEDIEGRPLSAKAIYDKAKYIKAMSVKTLKPVEEAKDNISEADILDNVSRSKVDIRTIKKNTYQIKSKGTVSGISGYRAQKLIDIDKKEDAEEELKKKESNKFSPFLVNPMNEDDPIGDIFDTGQKRSNNLLPLEYFIFPEHLDKDNVVDKYKAIQENSADSRVYGYTKYYDNHGAYKWERCELLNYDPAEEKFEVKWIDKFVTKKVTRANFYFEMEDHKEYFKMLTNAIKWRELCCTYMRYQDIIDKMKTPTNELKDEIKDRITLLVLNNQFKLRPPRDPTKLQVLAPMKRFDCNKVLTNPHELYLPEKYNVVEHFASKTYDLKYFNKLNDEISNEFVRANHQIELESSLPYNHQLQKMFKGLLDDSLFIPLYIKQRLPSKQEGLLVSLSKDKREIHAFIGLYETLKTQMHQANPERVAIIREVNSYLDTIRKLCFVMSNFEKGFDVSTFMANQSYSSQTFFREISDRCIDINEKIFNIVTALLDEIKRHNEMIEMTVTVASEKESKLKKVPPSMVRYYTRYMNMINFKFEYYIKEALRASLQTYNKTFQSILDKFERMMNAKHGSINFAELSYETVLDYQNHMQYQKHSKECPLVLVNLSINDKAIVLDNEMATFKDDLKNVDLLLPSGSSTMWINVRS